MTLQFTLSAVLTGLSAMSLVAIPSSGGARWDALTHHVIAAIAYERLQPGTRARVDSLLRFHPDLESLRRGLDVATPDGSRELFMRVSVWPDLVRRDPRFYDEASTASVATPLLPGYPDMQRHASWHYMSQSFATDGTTPAVLGVPNTVTQLAALARAVGDASVPAAVRAYDLAWVVHIVSDLHQPLHGTSRSSRRFPNGDAGGNSERVQHGAMPGDTINLHAFWDGVVTRANRGGAPLELARRLAIATPVDVKSTEISVNDLSLDATLGDWAAESATLARYVVYDIDPRAEGAAPPRTTPAYERLAEQIARQRVTLAGYRLAALLETRLR